MRKLLLLLPAAAILAVALLTTGGPAAAARRPNVVLIIMDEFPGDSLLGRDGRIDAVRYPNFAALASTGTWFPNASTVYDSTPKAVPLIMDGRRPFKGQSPDARGHPRTLFDMFGRRGYRIVDSEDATAICPPRWCGHRRKPDVIRNLGPARQQRFERFVRTIRPGRRPTFWLKHVLLPHAPYLFLPSGRRTRAGAFDPIHGLNGPPGFHDRFLTQHNEQRYVLQLGFADHELGQLLRQLRREGMFDSTLIVVTADHGMSFKVGVRDRRRVNLGNVDEIAPVPLFVKEPGQRGGRTDRSYATTLDVAPTIADVLNFRLPYRADGHSAFSRVVRRRHYVRLPTRDFDRIIRISGSRWEARRRAQVRRRLRLFGFGAEGLFTGIGPNRRLLGRSVSSLPVLPQGPVRASLIGASRLRDVRRSSGIVPCEILGSVRGGRRGAKRDIAVAVNGRIEAVGRTFYLRGDRREHLAANVPEASLREGANRVEVFQVEDGRLRPLARV